MKMYSMRCNESMIEKVDEFAAKSDFTRSEAIRYLINYGLETLCNEEIANQFVDFLSSRGYQSVSDIPNEELDSVTEAYLEWAKKQN